MIIYVAGYCRVSTDKEDQANSYNAQQSYFRDYITRHSDWELYKIYADEGLSGTSTKKRIQFNQMIHDAQEGKFQLILTKEVSRFSRNIVDTLSYTRLLKQLGVAVEFVTDHINTMDNDGELRLSIMATLAQDESRKTSNRVVWGQTRRMEKGVVFGTSMLGYEVEDGKLMIEPNGAEIVRLIFQKYAVEQVGTSEIARFLTRERYRTYRGSSIWKPNTVIKILKNEKYVGDLIQRKTYTPDYLSHERRANKGNVPLICLQNHHDPIISRDIWNLAQDRLRQNNKHAGGKAGHSNRYIFSGKIKCAECGSSFVGRTRVQKDGTRIRRWRCGTAADGSINRCTVGKLIRDDDALNMLKLAIRSLQIDTEHIISSVTALTMESIYACENSTRDTPERLQFEISRIRHKTESVMELYLSGEISKKDMLAMKKRYEIQEVSFRTRLKEAMQKRDDRISIFKQKQAIIENTTALLNGDMESEAFYKNLLNRMTVFKDKHMELTLLDLPLVFHFK